ncbi:MAG: hypothetical protein QOG53_429 [Frankiales bacterium]|jgi:uncharacterized protein (DUF1697 family)|nr:hypothetical protein [Frankiales bacterium]
MLLRGVNLAGHRRIAMADLRELLEGLGYADVKTHLQGGNAVVTTAAKADAVARKVSAQIAESLGLDVDVTVRTHAELTAVVKRNPFKQGLKDPAKFLVSFLASKPHAKLVTAVESESFAPDKFWVDGREVYMWCPNGVGRAKLPKDFFAKRLAVSATARNWNTVSKLVELTAAYS